MNLKTSLKQPSLKVHEWLAILIFIVVIAVLTAVTTFSRKNPYSYIPPFLPSAHHFAVEINGSVRYPGVYHLSTPRSLRELLMIAEATADADVRRYNLDALIVHNKKIDLSKLNTVTVYVEGAVKDSKEMTLPSGTTLQELIPLLEFQEEANIKLLQKKRKLKDGEMIRVLKSKVKN